MALVERRDRVVPKAELLDLVWPRLVVEENNLQVRVLTLRKLLGPQAIATVPGRGYRFTAAVGGIGAAQGPGQAGAAAGSLSPRAPGSPLSATAVPAVPTAPTAPHDTDPAIAAMAPMPALIGRDTDRQELAAALREHRLVTLLGAGGVGKSTLARHVTQAASGAFADGIAWVELTAVRDDAGVVAAVATATRSTLARGDDVKSLASALATQRLLLVLDNAEHVLDGVLAVASALHGTCSGLHLLVTSQAPLRLTAEQLYRLDPLALPDPQASLAEAAASAAVQLFVARVRASDRHFVLDAHNLAPVVSLTRRLDGLPLAIEMAAARVPALSPAQLDAALHERFRLLTRGDRSAPARQQTLAAALSWTHDLLGPEERAVFRRLGVFVGTFSLPAAQAVCSDHDGAAGGEGGAAGRIDEWQVLDALAVLVDRSLVAPPVGEPPRYRLLDTPQAFALQRLAAAPGDEAATRQRHLAHFRSLFETAYEEHLWARRPVSEWLATYAPDADNGLAALNHAMAMQDDECAMALVPGLAQALVRRHAERFSTWHRTEPLLRETLPARSRARWQLGFAQFWGVNSMQRSHPHARDAATLFLAEGQSAGEYRARAILATSLAMGTSEDTSAALARMRELEGPDWPADLRFLRRWAEATRLAEDGHYDQALAAGHNCMELIRQSGRSGRLIHEMGMVFLAIMADRLDEAVERGLAGMRRLREHQRRAPASGVELLLLAAWLLRGDVQPARELGPPVWEAGRAFNQKGAVADTLTLLAAREGRPRAAVILAGYAAAEYARGATKRLAVYRRCGEAAEAIAARALTAPAMAALRERGRHWPDAGIAALAFGATDADAPPEGDAQAASS